MEKSCNLTYIAIDPKGNWLGGTYSIDPQTPGWGDEVRFQPPGRGNYVYSFTACFYELEPHCAPVSVNMNSENPCEKAQSEIGRRRDIIVNCNPDGGPITVRAADSSRKVEFASISLERPFRSQAEPLMPNETALFRRPTSPLAALPEVQDAQVIQRLIDRAEPGQTITIPEGVYAGSLVIEGKENLTIEGNNALIIGEGDKPILTILKSNNVTVKDLKLALGHQGIRIMGSSSITLEQDTIERNSWIGIYILNGEPPTEHNRGQRRSRARHWGQLQGDAPREPLRPQPDLGDDRLRCEDR